MVVACVARRRNNGLIQSKAPPYAHDNRNGMQDQSTEKLSFTSFRR